MNQLNDLQQHNKLKTIVLSEKNYEKLNSWTHEAKM